MDKNNVASKVFEYLVVKHKLRKLAKLYCYISASLDQACNNVKVNSRKLESRKIGVK